MPEHRSSLQSYNNNDIGTAASQVNDAISANPDLVGVFADNNSFRRRRGDRDQGQ